MRAKLLPLLEKQFNPRAKETLSQLGLLASEAQAYLDRQASVALKACASRPRRGRLVLDVRALGRLHPALRKTVFIRAVEALRGHTRRLTLAHVDAALGLTAARSPASETHLPGMRAVRRGARLELIDTPAK